MRPRWRLLAAALATIAVGLLVHRHGLGFLLVGACAVAADGIAAVDERTVARLRDA